MQSLRWRLLSTVCIAALLGLGLSGALTYRKAQQEAEELMDGHLAQTARLLLALVRDNESHLADLATRLATVRSDRASHYDPPLEFQIRRADGSLLLRSEHPPDTPLSASPGYTVIEHDGHRWRMLTLTLNEASGDYRVQVGQSIRLRDRAALEVATQSVVPIALMSPVLLLLIYYSVRRGLQPLDDLAAEVASRSPENLKPLASGNAPLEVQPLLAALNRLIFRLRGTLESERRFTADAAHELRTPLAVVKIQAQVAQLSGNADDRQHALAQIVAGADRATRVLEQLLRLARLDPLARLPNPGEIDLTALARQAVADTAPTREAGVIRLQVSDSPLLVRGDGELLQIALRNLLDNAVRYTPPDSTITVFARRHDGALSLGVIDDGRGVPPDELPRLVERFYRGCEPSAEGSGLGLAITQRIAELHEARFEVENLAGGGFEARLCWGRTWAA
ncbi:ATP-binding protein [Candidatus Accumulibacter aalborgensis]|uniref:ATP-binding protein n=1 Tax=Candidatus Accumulibacter aalborgensis TaxID=1860102 RepID=UPI001FE0A77D|nr:ATP-binding protein [Candidatus Accumulibacter aalborgensis]